MRVLRWVSRASDGRLDETLVPAGCFSVSTNIATEGLWEAGQAVLGRLGIQQTSILAGGMFSAPFRPASEYIRYWSCSSSESEPLLCYLDGAVTRIGKLASSLGSSS